MARPEKRGPRIIKRHTSKIMKKGRGEEGWSLMEVMIGIAIVMILTGTVAFVVGNQVTKAKKATARNHIVTFSLALDTYMLDCGQYPTEDQGLKALVEKPILSPLPTGWGGPYLSTTSIPKDPWGSEYEYKVPGPGGLPYGIRSFGADKVEGGEDYDADITSWQMDG